MKIKFPHPPLPATACILALISPTVDGATIASVGTTGTFDAAAGGAIDNDPTGSLSAFKTAVTTAYNNNLGGVINWETATGMSPSPTASAAGVPNNVMTTIGVSYGTSASQTLTITFDRNISLFTNNLNGQVADLTNGGTNSIIPEATTAAGVAYRMTFSGATVSEIGLGMLARTTYGTNGANFRATATFNDLTTSLINYSVTSGATDTFLHFAAPSGKSISFVDVTWVSDGSTALTNGARRPMMDDFGFIVIPEPSVAVMSGLAALGLLIRRRC